MDDLGNCVWRVVDLTWGLVVEGRYEFAFLQQSGLRPRTRKSSAFFEWRLCTKVDLGAGGGEGRTGLAAPDPNPDVVSKVGLLRSSSAPGSTIGWLSSAAFCAKRC